MQKGTNLFRNLKKVLDASPIKMPYLHITLYSFGGILKLSKPVH